MMEHSPAVSVIIPTFNSSGTLKLALTSVLQQDFTDFEVWVVGDGCTDESETMVYSFNDARLHWTNLPVNSGTPSAPRNEGLRRARGKYIAYLGHDDLWFPWHLSELVQSIAGEQGDFICSLGILLGPRGVFSSFSLPNRARDRQYISPSNWLHRNDLIDSIGPWSTKLLFGDDRDFLDRLLASPAHMVFRKQLSVIKYPSSLWRMYSLTSDFPQQNQLHAMISNAEELRLSLLLDLATCPSARTVKAMPRRNPLDRAFRAMVRKAFESYGRHRWPVNRFLYRRWRKRSGFDDKQRTIRRG